MDCSHQKINIQTTHSTLKLDFFRKFSMNFKFTIVKIFSQVIVAQGKRIFLTFSTGGLSK